MHEANLKGCQVEIKTLEMMVKEKEPKLAEHLHSIYCETTIIATEWYLCLFCTTLPPETCCRLWDALLNEGNKILHRVALAALK